jgi:hypothetical protein
MKLLAMLQLGPRESQGSKRSETCKKLQNHQSIWPHESTIGQAAYVFMQGHGTEDCVDKLVAELSLLGQFKKNTDNCIAALVATAWEGAIGDLVHNM